MTTPSARLDSLIDRLGKKNLLTPTVQARLEEAALIVAKKMSTADKAKMQREAKKKKKAKVWVSVTSQPEKTKGGSYVGRATFQRKGEDEKHSEMITLQGPAKIRVKGKKLWVKPKKGEGYYFGENEDEAGAKDKNGDDEVEDLAPPTLDSDKDGVDDNARVGVPADLVPTPPAIPRLDNLTDEEKAIEGRFVDAFESDPEAMTKKYADAVIKIAAAKKDVPTFVTDDTKVLSPDYSGDKPLSEMSDEERAELGAKRARNNTLLHQTANAVAKRAFVAYLDELEKLPEGDPKRSVLVTSGGCGSGKGFSLKNNQEAISLKSSGIGAVWDAAGEQNATENPWILDECKKRGLKAHFVFVDADPMRQWSHDKVGVMSRAKTPPPEGEGRMVDSRLFADSYALGAKNFNAFFEKHKDSKDANFMFIDTMDTDAKGFPVVKTGKGISSKSLKLNADDLYKKAVTEVEKNAPTDAIREGALKGQRIWGEGAEATASTATEWFLKAGFVFAEDEDAEEDSEAEKPAESTTAKEAEDTFGAALAAELAHNLSTNQQDPASFYKDKAETHEAIRHGADKPEPEEEEDMKTEDTVEARIDAVAARLSRLALPSEVLLAVEEAADAVSKVSAKSDLSLHLAAEVDELMGEAYRKMHTLKAEMDKFEEIPNYLKSFYDEVLKAANAIGEARTGRKASTTQVREMAKKIARQVQVKAATVFAGNYAGWKQRGKQLWADEDTVVALVRDVAQRFRADLDLEVYDKGGKAAMFVAVGPTTKTLKEAEDLLKKILQYLKKSLPPGLIPASGFKAQKIVLTNGSMGHTYIGAHILIEPSINAKVSEVVRGGMSQDAFDEGRTAALSVVKAVTFKAAQAKLLDHLEENGWRVNRDLKVPWAETPEGKYRLWFKAQAIWIGSGGKGSKLSDARSTWIDPREVTPESFMKEVKDWQKIMDGR